MPNQKLRPIHPGEVLNEEFIKPLNISQRKFAELLGVTHTRLNQIVLEKRAITADSALRLSKALGTTPGYWMNLQTRFDLDVAEDQHGDQIEKEVHPIQI